MKDLTIPVVVVLERSDLMLSLLIDSSSPVNAPTIVPVESYG